MIIKEVIEVLETYFPLSLQDDWDNSGLQIGNQNKEVKSIMIALNADYLVVKQAVMKNIDLLITHHPLFFEPIKALNQHEEKGRVVELAIKNNLSIYCSHTPLDKGGIDYGMNSWAAMELGLKNIDIYGKSSHLRKGENNSSLDVLIKNIKKTFSLDSVLMSGDSNAEIVNNIVIGLGSGSGYIKEMDSLIDVYITGDCSYHDAQAVVQNKTFVLIQVPHFVEAIMKKHLKLLLKEHLELPIYLANEEDYIKIV